MISYMRAGDKGDGKAPLHKLTETQTRCWLTSRELQRALADGLAKRYQQGVGVCTATLRLIAYVAPNGRVQELPPPHRGVQRWELANQPAVSECPCLGFFDPEVQGPWRQRGSEAHHPLCQYDPNVFRTFSLAIKKETLPADLQNRPDLWSKLRDFGK